MRQRGGCWVVSSAPAGILLLRQLHARRHVRLHWWRSAILLSILRGFGGLGAHSCRNTDSTISCRWLFWRWHFDSISSWQAAAVAAICTCLTRGCRRRLWRLLRHCRLLT